MPKINQEEYELLKSLDERAKSIVRQARGWLWVAEQPIMKDDRSWFVADGFDAVLEDDNMFQFIQWEDEEPHNIAELIEEYKADELNRQLKELVYGESVGKEVKKDKEWLKEAILALKNKGNPENNQTEKERELGRAQQWAWNNCVDRAYELVKQLDEPEVLSKEWIDENGRLGQFQHGGGIHFNYFVKARDLQNLLVPKQELPVIPKFVAKWISEHHERFDLYPALKRLENNALSWEDVYEWYRRNTYIFVNAYLTGKYEVEVEEKQKYYVLDKDNIIMIGKVNNEKVMKRNFLTPFNNFSESAKEKAQLTEQEIKDYDPRFWPFAVKVEELEE